MKQTLILRDYHLKVKAQNLISDLPYEPVHEVIIREHKSSRSLAQNRLLWMWLTHISQQHFDKGGEFYSPETWKIYFQQVFLEREVYKLPKGHIEARLKGTSKLNTKEFTEFLNDIDHYCGSELEIYLPHPDIYGEAMGCAT